MSMFITLGENAKVFGRTKKFIINQRLYVVTIYNVSDSMLQANMPVCPDLYTLH